MTLDPWVLATILAMSVATYVTRAGGYLLFRTFRPGAGLRAMLGYIPGTLFIAYVAPALAAGRWPEWAGSAAAIGIMVVTREMSAAVLGGTAVAWLVWAWL
ncbi:MAG: hypothetical protein NVSMB18_17800 [Acetobacteraceae bacterium]